MGMGMDDYHHSGSDFYSSSDGDGDSSDGDDSSGGSGSFEDSSDDDSDGDLDRALVAGNKTLFVSTRLFSIGRNGLYVFTGGFGPNRVNMMASSYTALRPSFG